jgi:cell division protein FtsB
MGRVNDTISNVNSAFRNVLLAVLIGGAGIGGYKAYDIYNEPKQKLADKEAELEKTAASLKQANEDLAARQQEISTLKTDVAEKQARIDRLEVARQLLQVRHRLARVKVLDQHEVPSLNPTTPSSGTENSAGKPSLATKIEFTEIDKEGKQIGAAKQFDIVGDMVYVDFQKVTFDDKFIEANDMNRSTSLALFQRIFGEHQEPAKGYQLDTVGVRPTAYDRGSPMSEYEKKIWDNFWLIANDPKRAAEEGIRAANGDAVSMRMQPGKTYEIDLRSTGEISVRTVEPPAPPAIVPTSGS